MAQRFLSTAILVFIACGRVLADCDDDEMDLCEGNDAPTPMPTTMPSGCDDDPELDLCADDEGDGGEAPTQISTPSPESVMACASACPNLQSAGNTLTNVGKAMQAEMENMGAELASACPGLEEAQCLVTNAACKPLLPGMEDGTFELMDAFCKNMPGNDMEDCSSSCEGQPENCAKLSTFLSTCASNCSSQTKAFLRVLVGSASASKEPCAAADEEVVTSFDTELELDNVTKFDTDKFKEAMAAASSVSADKVEIEKVEYKTKVKYSMPEAVTEAAAKTAIAKSCKVMESQVEVSITARRLSELRRLATTINAMISTQNKSMVGSIVKRAADPAALKMAFADADLIVEPTVTEAPSTSVVVSTKLKGKAEKPADDAIQSKVAEKVGTAVTVKAGDEPSPAPTTPTPAPAGEESSSKPSPAPPTPTPAPAAEESPSVDDAKGKTPPTLLACATATMAAMLLDAA